jgi:hypothetical protein
MWGYLTLKHVREVAAILTLFANTGCFQPEHLLQHTCSSIKPLECKPYESETVPFCIHGLHSVQFPFSTRVWITFSRRKDGIPTTPPPPSTSIRGDSTVRFFKPWPVLKVGSLDMVRLDLVSQAWAVIKTWLIFACFREKHSSLHNYHFSLEMFFSCAMQCLELTTELPITVIMVGREHRFISRRFSYS